MLDVRQHHDPQRRLLQMRQLRHDIGLRLKYRQGQGIRCEDVGADLEVGPLHGRAPCCFIHNCAVYVIDLLVQASGLHAEWAKGRVLPLTVGTAFAAVIAHFFSMNILEGGRW